MGIGQTKVKEETILHHDATVVKITQINKSMFEILISPKLVFDRNLHLSVDDPNFYEIYNALEIGKTYTFEYVVPWKTGYIKKVTSPRQYEIDVLVTGFLNIDKEFKFDKPIYQLMIDHNFNDRRDLRLVIDERLKEFMEINCIYKLVYEKNGYGRLYSIVDMQELS